MATFSEVKADIADEINRTDLTTQIEKSVIRAITFYQSDRFWFSEERSESETEAGEPYYPLPSDFVKRIAFIAVKDGRNNTISARPVEYIQDVADDRATGLPFYHTIIDQQIRLYPVPDNTYQLILHYYKEITLPSVDDDELEWTLDITEQLIRYRAKKEIYINYLHDPGMYQAMAVLEEEIYAKMKERNALHILSGHVQKENLFAENDNSWQ